MKILHVLYSNRFSGAENVVCQIIGMFKNDADVEMVYCSPDGQIREALGERNITFAPLKKFNKKELKRVIKEQKPDVIHAHGYRASIMATRVTKKLPIISHLHNNVPWLKRYGIKTFLYAKTCKKYVRIITVSESVFNEFVFGDKYKSKLTVLWNPVDSKKICEESAREQIDECYDIVFCGRLTPQKNPFFLLNIISEVKKDIPTIKVAIIGDGELRDEIIKVIKEKSLGENITLYGFRKNPYAIMKKAKLLLLPSLWEGFGLVAVEALSLGVPVVCSGVGGLSNIVNDDCGKICKSLEDYSKEIKELVLSDAYQKEKSVKARLRAEELDNISDYKLQLEKIYNLKVK